MLYGSLRERSYSKLLTLEAARLLETMGAEVWVFDPPQACLSLMVPLKATPRCRTANPRQDAGSDGSERRFAVF